MSERDIFIEQIAPSPDALAKLDRYEELLKEWSEKFNLVAASTLPHMWNRHFLDSAQLQNYVPHETKTIADLGAGAGFPGIVLAILGTAKVYLIESTGKKADFLRAVISELKLNAEVRQERAETLRDMTFDLVTARALAPLPELLNLANPLINNGNMCLFLKGQNVDAELTESAKYWSFKAEKHKSASDPSGSVLVLKDIKNNGARRISKSRK